MNAFANENQSAARYVTAVREHWLLIAVIVVAAVAGAVLYSSTAEKRYEAEADILVTPISSDDPTFIGITLIRESSQSRAVLTAARLIQTPSIADAVKIRLSRSESRGQLLDMIAVRPQEQSNIVTVVGSAPTARLAADLANAFAMELIGKRTEIFQRELMSVIERSRTRLSSIPPGQRQFGEAVAIQQRLGELAALVGAADPTLQVSSEAVPPNAPVWPRPKLSIAAALVAALLLGVGLAVALEVLNPRVKREDELMLEHRLPILARVPRMSKSVLRANLDRRAPLPGDVREAYRTLRASIATSGPTGGFPETILITSSVPGEGKTMTSVNLATTLAQAGMKVILVDGDLRRPMIGTVLGVGVRGAGFAGLLLGRATIKQTLIDAPGHHGNLLLLLSSPENAHLIDLLQPARIEKVFEELRVLEPDVIVVDSPPVTEVADALTLADAVDIVLVTVRLGKTRRDKLAQLRRMLAQRSVSPIGFVVTTRRSSRRSGYYHTAEETARRTMSARRQPRVQAQQPTPQAQVQPQPQAQAQAQAKPQVQPQTQSQEAPASQAGVARRPSRGT